MMDLSKIKPVTTINPRKPEVVKPEKKVFNIKIDYKDEKVILSKKLIEELNIEVNSLAHSTENEDGTGKIFILLMPGNTGTFAKATAKGSKGSRFKNHKLVQLLTSRGLVGGKFNVEKVGELEGIVYYELVEFIPEGEEAPTTEVVAVTISEESVESVSFN